MTEAKRLQALIEAANRRYTELSPEQQAEHNYEQRRSFVRGMCPYARDYDEWCEVVDRLLPPRKERGLMPMGMFDSVMVRCPKCGLKNEIQTKSGDCKLAVYELGDAPPNVMGSINKNAPFTCDGCGAIFEIKLQCTGTPVLVKG